MTRDAAPVLPAHPGRPAPSDPRRNWRVALLAVLAGYAILTLAIIVGSPLDRVDLFFYRLDLVPATSPLHFTMLHLVLIGDGFPASTVAALYAIRRCRQTRAWRPWVMFTIGLVLLNTSVGLMKYLTGRLGPRQTDVVHTIWAGGTIFPSGHAANTVVMFGIIAMIAPQVSRSRLIRLAVLLSAAIGLGTVAINTHWISDVFGGWLAGGLVLLVMWRITPPVDRLVTGLADRIVPAILAWWASEPFRRPAGTPRTLGAPGPLGAPPARAVVVNPLAVTGMSSAPATKTAAAPATATASAPVTRTVTPRPPAPRWWEAIEPAHRHAGTVHPRRNPAEAPARVRHVIDASAGAMRPGGGALRAATRTRLRAALDAGRSVAEPPVTSSAGSR